MPENLAPILSIGHPALAGVETGVEAQAGQPNDFVVVDDFCFRRSRTKLQILLDQHAEKFDALELLVPPHVRGERSDDQLVFELIFTGVKLLFKPNRESQILGGAGILVQVNHSESRAGVLEHEREEVGEQILVFGIKPDIDVNLVAVTLALRMPKTTVDTS